MSTETVSIRKCPLCGAKLDENSEPRIANELFQEIQKLKDQGILNQTIFVAVKIVQSMNENNPAWLRELLEEQSKDFKENVEEKLIREIRPVLRAVMELKGSPQTLGRIQESALAKRLSALKTGQDVMKTEKSLKSGEDVECLVIEGGKEMGKIVIESKRTKRWREEYAEQIRKYMKKENMKFGILATKTMPSDALSYSVWRNDVLVVDLEHVEMAYLFMRAHLILKGNLEQEYNSKIKQLEISDQILQAIEEAVNDGQLNKIITDISKQTIAIDDAVANLETKIQRAFRKIRNHTGKTRTLVAQLMTNHIEKIRSQLVGRIKD